MPEIPMVPIAPQELPEIVAWIQRPPENPREMQILLVSRWLEADTHLQYLDSVTGRVYIDIQGSSQRPGTFWTEYKVAADVLELFQAWKNSQPIKV